MAFIQLDNPKVGGRRCSKVGALITVRESGPAGNRSRFLAVLVGADVAKSLNFVTSPTPVAVALGNGDDLGKLQIAASPSGKFVAKKQAGGGWLVTVRECVLGRQLKTGARITIDRARQVPAASAHVGPCTIVSIKEALDA